MASFGGPVPGSIPASNHGPQPWYVEAGTWGQEAADPSVVTAAAVGPGCDGDGGGDEKEGEE